MSDWKTKVTFVAQICASFLALTLSIGATAEELVGPDPYDVCLQKLKDEVQKLNDPLFEDANALTPWGPSWGAVTPELTAANLVEKKYVWQVHAGQRAPSEIYLSAAYRQGERMAILKMSLQQNRTAETFFSLVVSRSAVLQTNSITTEWNVDQIWDVDSDCQRKLFATSYRRGDIQGGRLNIKSQLGDEQDRREPERSASIELKPGTFVYSLGASSRAAVVAKMSKVRFPLFMIGTVDVPALWLEKPNFRASQKHWNPLTNSETLLSGWSGTTVVVGRAPFFELFSADDRFVVIANGDDETWILPSDFWRKGYFNRLSHESDNGVEREEKAALDGEPKVITTDSQLLADYPNLSRYWSIKGRDETSGLYKLKSGTLINYISLQSKSSFNFPKDEKFLRGSKHVQPQLPEVQALAHRAQAMASGPKEENPVRIAIFISRLIAESMRYDYSRLEAGNLAQDVTTAEILKKKSGTCQNFANLFAAIARSLGIPTRIVYGLYLSVTTAIPHAWNEIEIAPGTWVPINPEADSLVFNPSNYLPMLIEPNDTYTDKDFAAAIASEKTAPQIKIISTRDVRY